MKQIWLDEKPVAKCIRPSQNEHYGALLEGKVTPIPQNMPLLLNG